MGTNFGVEKMASAKREPIMKVWGIAAAVSSPGARPLVRSENSLKLSAF